MALFNPAIFDSRIFDVGQVPPASPSPVVCEGIIMYDPRHSFKAQAGEVLSMGESLYLATDGKVYAIDDDEDGVCHGWGLEDAVMDDWITIVTTCRMMVSPPAEIIGALARVGAISGGSVPSTTLTGITVGFAVTNKILILHTTFPPPQSGLDHRFPYT